MAIQQDIEFFSGNDITLKFTVTDNDTALPLNLTGALAIRWELAKKAGATPILAKALGSGVSIADALTGRIDVVVSAADSEPLKGAYYHELRLTNSQSKKVTLAYGAAVIDENLVRN